MVWYLIPYIKVKKDLNVRVKTIKFLEEKRGVNLHDLELISDFS